MVNTCTLENSENMLILYLDIFLLVALSLLKHLDIWYPKRNTLIDFLPSLAIFQFFSDIYFPKILKHGVEALPLNLFFKLINFIQSPSCIILILLTIILIPIIQLPVFQIHLLNIATLALKIKTSKLECPDANRRY